jgi:hypothetical protein
VFALQSQLNLSIHVLAKTVLEEKGLAHFLPLENDGYGYSLRQERSFHVGAIIG